LKGEMPLMELEMSLAYMDTGERRHGAAETYVERALAEGGD